MELWLLYQAAVARRAVAIAHLLQATVTAAKRTKREVVKPEERKVPRTTPTRLIRPQVF